MKRYFSFNYRTKVILVLISFAIITNGVLLGIMYKYTKDIVFQEIQSKVLSIAATTGSLLDGDLHNKIKTRNDESTETYKTLEKQLRSARNANRRKDIYVKYIYTMKTHTEKSDIITFVIDPEEKLEDKSHVGDIYKSNLNKPLDIDKSEADKVFTEDQWGKWLSANAPVKDHRGISVASLGVDVSATDVIKKLDKIFNTALFALAISILLALLISFVISRWINKPLDIISEAVDMMGKGNLDINVDINTNDEFGGVAEAINSLANKLKKHDTLKIIFARYLSKQIADNIFKSGKIPNLKGERRKITVLFSDIRGFTTLSENMPPEEVVRLLNEYFEKMIDVLSKYNGHLDKLIGDGMMVTFGAIKDDLFQEENAIKTALEMKDELEKLCIKWGAEGRVNIRIGIGINSGIAIVGNIGSSQRIEHTAIGDTVNLASRIETATKDLGVDILFSEYTYNTVRNIFKSKNMGSIHVKGRSDPVTVYSVI